ncbi:hypothetical protein HDU76_006796 [Blyttiomyces sp. JEL0837]|nr:hypothetical protein HDU76_006796 [Blyttiomyces sp. JEL0837]
MTTSNSGSTSCRIKSYWDELAPEVKNLVLDNCDLLTQYLNNHLTEKEIETHSVDIWNLAIKFNFPGELSTLPKELPNVKNGLANITSRDFYKRLCMFRPDLTGTDMLRKFMQNYGIWYWLSPPWHSEVEYLIADMSNEANFCQFRAEISELSLSTMFLHIPLRQQWMDDEDLVQVMEHEDVDFDPIKLWVINGFFGHIGPFKRTLEDFLKMPESCLRGIMQIPLSRLCNFILRLAACEGVVDVVKLLLGSGIEGIDVTTGRNDCIKMASSNGHLDVVALLLAKNVDPTSDDCTSFKNAAENGRLDVLRVLLNSVDGDDFGFAANKSLYGAASGGRLEIVKYLLGLPETDVGFEENCVFIAACAAGHFYVAKFLLGVEGVNPFDGDNLALLVALDRGHKDIAELSGYCQTLLRSPGVDASALDNEAIKNAARSGHHEIVKLLVGAEGVNATACNKAIVIASSSGHVKVLEELLKVPGVDAATRDNEAIRKASRYGYYEVVKAIREASIRGHVKVVEELLKVHGVDATSKNNEAVVRALTKNHGMVVELLE